MIRFAYVILFACLAIGSIGCDKPEEASCRKAIDNMRRLMGTENLTDNNKLEGEVRRCKGGSSKKAVACAINAKTYDELRACGFSKLPATPPFPAAGGSAEGSGAMGSAAAGSAAMGSAAAGSAAAGSAMGSAAAGSAAMGSAAMGSAAMGSAAGSATAASAAAGSGAGSAGPPGSGAGSAN